MAVGARIPLPAQCQERTGQAGHRHAQIQNGYLRQRLFLAWTRRLQAVCSAENQYRFLAGEDRPQPRTGPTELQRTDASRLASNRHLAMQLDQTEIGSHHAASHGNPESQLIENT